MSVHGGAGKIIRMVGIGTVLTVSAIVLPFGGAAFAAPAVTISPAGPYTDGQSVTVTGSGFPAATQISIVECQDTGGLVANLPKDNTTCDGTTENPLPITTNSSGAFSTSYSMTLLSTKGGASVINCDASNFCVLWAGLDFVNQFTSTHAFSSAFLVKAPITATPEAPLAIALPIGAAILVGGTIFVARRRRSSLVT